MANITKKPNGTFLIRVSNGMKNGKQDLVSTIYKPPVGSTSAMARKAAEKYAVLFEELVHSGGYEKKQAVSREIRARRIPPHAIPHRARLFYGLALFSVPAECHKELVELLSDECC